SGLMYDPQLAKVAAAAGCPVILMHNKMDKDYRDMMSEVIEQLQESIHIAVGNGIIENQIVVDPGIGFGKTPEQNLVVLKNLADLLALGRPVLLGVSRKSFIGKITDLPPPERTEGSLAAAVMGIMSGVAILRVHDVKETKRAAAVVDAIMRV
ncbi:MAG: dihydropteroate synthase, partial [Candidatus Saccharibacteria bacterium]